MQLGGDVVLYSAVFVIVLLGTRSPLWATVMTTSFYLFIAIFRFPQLPTSRVQQLLRPANRATGLPMVSVITHRGGGHDAPENTLAAIRESSKNGATGVELDLEFSADGIPILMHDDTLDRTTNGSGLLSQMSLSELRKLDAASKHRLRDKFAGEKIPTLEEAVEECIKLQLTIYFDVKGHADEAATTLKKLYQKHPVLYNSSIVCSFEPKVIYRMRQSDPEVITALTHRPWSLSRFGDGAPRSSSPWKHKWLTLMDILFDWAHHHVLWKLCGNSVLLMQKNFISQSVEDLPPLIQEASSFCNETESVRIGDASWMRGEVSSTLSMSRDYVQYWAQRGVEIVAWTLNTKVERDYYREQLKVSYITDSLVEDCEPHY